MLTTTMPFAGTWVITSMMLLGVIYLLCWDWNRLKYVVYPPQMPARAGVWTRR